MRIVVKINGGLGNQMFQYALGRKLSLTNKADLLLDLSFFDLPKGEHTARPFELDVFRMGYQRATDAELRVFRQARASRIRAAAHRVLPALVPYPIFQERGFAFDPSVFAIAQDTYVDGHWQSEKYFLDVAGRIRSDFEFATEPTGANEDLARAIRSSNSIGIHVRRGDYVHHVPASDFHGTCGADYYEQAVSRITGRETGTTLFIFSDDIAWAREHLRFEVPTTFIDHNQGSTSYEDMRLMSLCKHNIIANSSFSWWAAWLNSNPTKLVIAPSRWFRDVTIDTRDLIPDAWIKL